ncbi:LytTR family DNA-binding domain-containing protein [Pontimicrobium sp. SW4]|uniref:LytTR family DNA-binding domain-containing protein n=1 Tax=Pontimicrobium sp. SW4 TaxID=3153519 RepID=A0AAU7BP77_9FLAO
MIKQRAILIDDEVNSLEILEYELLNLNRDIEIVAKCSDARKVANIIESEKPNLVFLDIEMPWLSGFEVLDQLTYLDFNLVFVTAYNQYAIKAFKYLAYDYLLKPVNGTELKNTLERIDTKSNNLQKEELKSILNLLTENNLKLERIPFPTQKGIEFIRVNDIIRFQADSNYTEIHTTDSKKTTISKTLKSIEELLDKNQFIRVHQSHLINLSKLASYIKEDGGYLKMLDNSIVPLSRSRKSLFLERITKV